MLSWLTQSSFPIKHKVINVGNFVLLKLENNLETIIVGHINFNSVYHDQFQFVLKLIQLEVSIIFSLEATQKCQHYQVCVISENSIPFTINLEK